LSVVLLAAQLHNIFGSGLRNRASARHIEYQSLGAGLVFVPIAVIVVRTRAACFPKIISASHGKTSSLRQWK
jgi:hypothetical protein